MAALQVQAQESPLAPKKSWQDTIFKGMNPEVGGLGFQFNLIGIREGRKKQLI